VNGGTAREPQGFAADLAPQQPIPSGPGLPASRARSAPRGTAQGDAPPPRHTPRPAVRNLFGTPKHADELYQGYGAETAQQRATANMMPRLAAHMMESPWEFPEGADSHNPDIPSGYTYLAQLAAHDLVSNIAPLPRPGDRASYFARDYRSGRLILD